MLATRGTKLTLELLGLSPTTISVYRLLLAEPDANLARIGTCLHVQESDARAALDELAALALVTWSDSRERAPRLVPPEVALSALVARQEADLAERQYQIERNRVAIAELLAARASQGHGEPPPDIERLEGVEAVRGRIEELAHACRQEVWSFNPGGAQSPHNLARSRPLGHETLARGVRMRAVYLDSVRNDDASLDHVRRLTEQGAEVRTVATLPLRMLIVDRERALVPLDERNSGAGALLVSGRGVLAALTALFVSTWKMAEPLGPRRRREPQQPSVQERQALRLWAQGGTDQAVARALGVSERTVRRISDALGERLGASSRFEMGARAMDAGWLSGDDLV